MAAGDTYQRINPAQDEWIFNAAGAIVGVRSNRANGADLNFDPATALTQINFTQSGTGAVARTGQDKLRERVSVKDFNAVGDGVTDDTAAFINAMAAFPGRAIRVPDPSIGYLITSKLTVPANTTLKGDGKQSTKLIKGFSGTFMELLSGAGLVDLYCEGQGGTFAGQGVVMTGTNGKQRIDDCRIINFDLECVYFNYLAGSQFQSTGLEAWRTSASSGTGRYAVVVEDVFSAGAVPRKFNQFESAGFCSFSFGGASDFFIGQSFVSDLQWSVNTRAVALFGGRWANQSAATIRGSNTTIVGGDIYPQITIAAGSDNITIGPASYNNLPVIDNSGNGRNLIYQWEQSYTPVISSGGTAPVLGNGTLVGTYSRNGPTVTVNINFTVGSTTNLGTGGISFSLPFSRVSTDVCVGVAQLFIGATQYQAMAVIGGALGTVAVVRDTSGSVTFNSPAVFAAGDVIRASITYQQ